MERPEAPREKVLRARLDRKDGPATWEILTFTVTDLGRNSALVTARWAFRRPDRSVVWDFFDSYHLCRLRSLEVPGSHPSRLVALRAESAAFAADWHAQ
jgi:hypothetical protein